MPTEHLRGTRTSFCLLMQRTACTTGLLPGPDASFDIPTDLPLATHCWSGSAPLLGTSFFVEVRRLIVGAPKAQL